MHRPGAKSKRTMATAASAGGLIAALLASVCCLGPLVFATLGVGVAATGFWADTAGVLKGIIPYQPVFIGLTVLLLGLSFYLVYRKPKSAMCAPKEVCVARTTNETNRIVLWMMTTLALVLLLAPYWLEILTR